MLKQRTLRNPIKAVGIGLHTGKNIAMELLPAEVNTGINFIRTDISEDFLIPAIAENVGDTRLSTALIGFLSVLCFSIYVYIIFNAAY